MFDFAGKKVLITGAASGIGKLMGELVLRKGASLIIWDINQQSIDTTISELSRLGEVKGYLVDVTNPGLVKEKSLEVKENHGMVDVLINNAGIVVGKFFHEHNTQEIDLTMEVNGKGPMYVTLAFLDDMIKLDSGHICNIASLAGLISNPRMSVYAASKWSVIGWSDSLRLEMKQLHKKVGVTTVLPYYINTGMFEGVRSIVPILQPEKVAKKIIRAIERNRIFLSMPWPMRFVRFLQGLLSIWLFDWFVGKVLGIYSTMEHFKGRQS